MDERVRLPKVIIYFLWIYMGIMGVMILSGVDMGDKTLFKVLWIVSLSVYTAAATYGIISLWEDFKNNGLKYIIRKVRRFINV